MKEQNNPQFTGLSCAELADVRTSSKDLALLSATKTFQVLLAIRGLGNMRQYGYEVENSLCLCGRNTRASDSVRVAAITALGRGPCSSQVRFCKFPNLR